MNSKQSGIWRVDRDLASMLFLVVGIALVTGMSAYHRLEKRFQASPAAAITLPAPKLVAVAAPVSVPKVTPKTELPIQALPVVAQPLPVAPQLAMPTHRRSPAQTTRSVVAKKASAVKIARVKRRGSHQNLAFEPLGLHSQHALDEAATHGFGSSWVLRDRSVELAEVGSVGFGRSLSQVPEMVFQGARNRSFVWRWQSTRDLSWPAADSARRAYLRIHTGLTEAKADSSKSRPRVSDRSDSAFLAGLRSAPGVSLTPEVSSETLQMPVEVQDLESRAVAKGP